MTLDDLSVGVCLFCHFLIARKFLNLILISSLITSQHLERAIFAVSEIPRSPLFHLQKVKFGFPPNRKSIFMREFFTRVACGRFRLCRSLRGCSARWGCGRSCSGFHFAYVPNPLKFPRKSLCFIHPAIFAIATHLQHELCTFVHKPSTLLWLKVRRYRRRMWSTLASTFFFMAEPVQLKATHRAGSVAKYVFLEPWRLAWDSTIRSKSSLEHPATWRLSSSVWEHTNT